METLKVVCVVLLAILVLTGGMLFVGNHMTFPGQVSQIEQLRKDVKSISKDHIEASEDVIGQVTQFNMEIAENKRYNQIWWSDPFVPDDWNKVELIAIPGE